MSAARVELPPLVEWGQFFERWRWVAGEHVTIVGPTGTGKTTLQRAIMHKRYAAGGSVCVLGTKTEDDVLEAWQREDGLTRVDSWPAKWPGHWWDRPRTDEWQRRLMLWPKLETVGDVAALGPLFRDALGSMFVARRWCVAVDELWYQCAELGLADVYKAWWSQGRSSGLSLVGSMQRPVDVPLLAYNSATHLFLFADPDERNLERISGLGALPPATIREMVRSLPFHDVLYVNTRLRVVLRTRVPV